MTLKAGFIAWRIMANLNEQKNSSKQVITGGDRNSDAVAEVTAAGAEWRQPQKRLLSSAMRDYHHAAVPHAGKRWRWVRTALSTARSQSGGDRHEFYRTAGKPRNQRGAESERRGNAGCAGQRRRTVRHRRHPVGDGGG